MMKVRNLTVDILRVIGILLVIMAHCGFPNTIFELRTFDVVLLVFVSGISYFLTSQSKTEKYFSYILKRFKRLVIPVWLFLFFFFFSSLLIGKLSFSPYAILTSFALLSGIGYIWIFRVFFVSAIISPIIKKLFERMNFFWLIIIITFLLIGNDILYNLININLSEGVIKSLLELFFVFTIGYSIPLIVGIKWLKFSNKEKVIVCCYFIFMFAVSGIILHFPSIQVFKYPPQFYYIVYGLMVGTLLYELIDRISIRNMKLCEPISWISKHSMTIYLWHVVIITLGGNYFPLYGSLNYWIRYLIILTLSTLLCIIQVSIKLRITEYLGRKRRIYE